MKEFIKDFSHGVSFGVFKQKKGDFRRRLKASFSSVADSVDTVIDSKIEHFDDILEDMQQELDEVQKDGYWIMQFLGWILMASVIGFAIVEFIYQLAGKPVWDVAVKTIVIASLSTLGAILTIPFAYIAMKPGRVMSRMFGLLIFVLCAGFGIYNMSSTAGQTNSNRLGTQKYEARKAVSNSARLEIKKEKLQGLEARGVSVVGRSDLNIKIKSALKTRDKRGRTLSSKTQDCYATSIATRSRRKACRLISSWRKVLKDKDEMILLKSDIAEIDNKISNGDKAESDDASSDIFADLLKTDKKTVQKYSNFLLMMTLGIILFSSELVYWDQVFDRSTIARNLERGIRHKKNALARDSVSPVAMGGGAAFVVRDGSIHDMVKRFISSNIFKITDSSEDITLPDMLKIYNKWGAEIGYPPMLIVDFREAVSDLYKNNELKDQIVLGQNTKGILTLKGLVFA